MTTNRASWPKTVVDKVLTDCHHRCCICPEHRRISGIHHIDFDHSNSVESNAVALCGECHPDVHTTSTMRRDISPDQVRRYKREWIAKCAMIDTCLRSNANEYRCIYYANVHRLDGLYRESGRKGFLGDIPHAYPAQDGHYNTLWPNARNSLDWTRLAENRAFIDDRITAIVMEVVTVDLNLFEVRAVDPEGKIGCLVGFSCAFKGHDIPSQSELIDSGGHVTGPPSTMRRQVMDALETESVTESCLMLDPQYFYSDSAFIHFSEQGIWNGIGRIIACRTAVGSNDGHLARRQIVISPICIGSPVNHLRYTRVSLEAECADSEYQKLIPQIGGCENGD